MSREDVFDKLETLVLDEERLVTCKILSREFQMHVNEARAYLADFLAVQKTKENVSLKATYFLAGLQEIDGIKSVKVLIASEESLEKAKNNLIEVTSCHIYSISKVRADEVVLYNTDLSYNHKGQESRDLLVIKHPNVEIKEPILRKSNQLKSDVKPPLKSQNIGALKNSSASIQTNGKSKTPSDAANNKAKETESEKPDKASTAAEPKKSNVEVQKPNTLASMWQKNEEKSKVAKTESSKTEGKGKTKSPQETKKSLPKNNIMSMFSKQAEKNAVNTVKKAPANDPMPEKKVEVVSNKPAEKVASTSKNPPKSNDKKRKLPEKKAKSSVKQSSDSDTEESKPAKKKHRRIAVFDDSDSNSDGEDIEAEDKAQRSLWLPEDPIEAESPVVAPTPDTDDGEDPIPPTPPVIQQKGRKKISKTVKKTFMDDDGFMVTTEEKEIVSESGSDEEPIPTKSSSKGSKEAVKSNNFSYRKQASLTNFFKKS
ncbi:hypothetical protein JTE90_007867 [Oedothorax gibbosus]|uniref:DNA polymerase delta subunit 3 n=1 Tax=Oedothorax gibbosus TaxID=931172 RepID=A0AAV6VJ03_9ARAC|nr:hypothetical protein JTE90_007867 [Oedothorax gibbosus]